MKEGTGLEFPNLPYFCQQEGGEGDDGAVRLSQMHAILRYVGERHQLCGGTPLERARVDMVVEAARDWIYDLFDVTYCTRGDTATRHVKARRVPKIRLGLSCERQST